ncbi:MAG: tetratricopeptide repeat protein [Bacteroidetes bacterium]|nr:tetratricopeptide repeat protein [Bacteroidota bacterium]MCW5896027.1 tetratricopeptide repeat protein [Bacteroidota bacterium]
MKKKRPSNATNRNEPEHATLPSSKKRAFAILTLLTPVILLAVAEGSLRVFGYGPNLSLFNKETHNGTEYCIVNPQVASRYFSSITFNPSTAPDYFLASKPDTTYRIFCLGGSTTAGFPYQFGGAFSAHLRDRLHAKFPERHIEVINLGMTATNSFTVLDIAEDIFPYKPDLLIVYDGHNEFYGALGISSNETLGSTRWLTRLYLKAVHLKIFLVMRDAYFTAGSLFRKDTPPQQTGGTMMEQLAKGQYVAYGNEEYWQAHAIYRQNLVDLRELCRKHSVPVLVGSQVSNLRDQPPFVSEPSGHLTPDRKRMFDDVYKSGLNDLRNGNFSSAVTNFVEATTYDSLRADARFLLAQSLDSSGQKPDALREYTKARDLDLLRFRASTDLNTIMREVADESTMFFVDIERKFRANAEDSLIGKTLLLEHLHPTEFGNFLIAKEYQWMMHWHKIMATQEEWNRRAATPDELLWEGRTVTELDRLAAQRRIQVLTSSWPFTDVDKPVPPPAHTDTLGLIVHEWTKGNLTWEQAHVRAAQYHERRGDIENEIREYRTLMKLLPLNVSPYLFLAKAYLKQQQNQEAASVLLRSLHVEKTWFAYKTLGILALEPEVAIPFLQNAVGISSNPDQKAEALYLLAATHLRAQQRAKALEQLREAVQASPGFTPARELLDLLTAKGT